ncbi:hypothetical protein GCM10023226_19420 [Nocardioides nanhaiensis]|uniref:Uncharacterized protein n=1 Tax=Nocardioides nanhaiensis TaxID=1476871 RepID=A0ABP8W7A1_9ACTN
MDGSTDRLQQLQPPLLRADAGVHRVAHELGLLLRAPFRLAEVIEPQLLLDRIPRLLRMPELLLASPTLRRPQPRERCAAVRPDILRRLRLGSHLGSRCTHPRGNPTLPIACPYLGCPPCPAVAPHVSPFASATPRGMVSPRTDSAWDRTR